MNAKIHAFLTRMRKQSDTSRVHQHSPYAQRVNTIHGARGILFILLRCVFPYHTLFPIWDELRAWKTRLSAHSTEKQYAQSTNLLVNLGAGSSGKLGWCNVDIIPLPHVTCVYDIRRRLPFPAESVRGIFCEHFFEHLDYFEEAPLFLQECYRVLQPGGVIRLIVPDGEAYLRAYNTDGWAQVAKLRGMDGHKVDPYYQLTYSTKMELINAVFRQTHEHKFLYDYETLKFGLQRARFVQIQRQNFGITSVPELAIDTPERRIESLYVEAAKPMA